MNDQCHDCKIRKLCYMEEPEEDWTCDHYEPCEYDEEDVTDINVGNKDAISRKAAIDALRKMQTYKLFSGDDMLLIDQAGAQTELMMLPPAQLSTNLAEVGTDCISRQAAIEAIDSFNVFESRGDQIKLEQMIGELPPAQPEQPEPKRGRWIYKTDLVTAPTGYWECSECKEGRLLYEENFCPHCGADMREVTE